MDGKKTAIITSVTIGRVDHYNDIRMTCEFDMNGFGCSLSFSMAEAKQMMNDVKVYDNIKDLVGKPCEILVDKNICKFLGMWKK